MIRSPTTRMARALVVWCLLGTARATHPDEREAQRLTGTIPALVREYTNPLLRTPNHRRRRKLDGNSNPIIVGGPEGDQQQQPEDLVPTPTQVDNNVSCDPVDNDCDGRTDDELAAPVPTEQCDGLDNDCDGITNPTPTQGIGDNCGPGIDNDCDGPTDDQVVAPAPTPSDNDCNESNALRPSDCDDPADGPTDDQVVAPAPTPSDNDCNDSNNAWRPSDCDDPADGPIDNDCDGSLGLEACTGNQKCAWSEWTSILTIILKLPRLEEVLWVRDEQNPDCWVDLPKGGGGGETSVQRKCQAKQLKGYGVCVNRPPINDPPAAACGEIDECGICASTHECAWFEDTEPPDEETAKETAMIYTILDTSGGLPVGKRVRSVCVKNPDDGNLTCQCEEAQDWDSDAGCKQGTCMDRGASVYTCKPPVNDPPVDGPIDNDCDGIASCGDCVGSGNGECVWESFDILTHFGALPELRQTLTYISDEPDQSPNTKCVELDDASASYNGNVFQYKAACLRKRPGRTVRNKNGRQLNEDPDALDPDDDGDTLCDSELEAGTVATKCPLAGQCRPKKDVCPVNDPPEVECETLTDCGGCASNAKCAWAETEGGGAVYATGSAWVLDKPGFYQPEIGDEVIVGYKESPPVKEVNELNDILSPPVKEVNELDDIFHRPVGPPGGGGTCLDRRVCNVANSIVDDLNRLIRGNVRGGATKEGGAHENWHVVQQQPGRCLDPNTCQPGVCVPREELRCDVVCGDLGDCGSCANQKGCAWGFRDNDGDVYGNGICVSEAVCGKVLGATCYGGDASVCPEPPPPPDCAEQTSCGSCAEQDGCTWFERSSDPADDSYADVSQCVPHGSCGVDKGLMLGECVWEAPKCSTPPPPGCGDHADCGTCAQQKGCSWFERSSDIGDNVYADPSGCVSTAECGTGKALGECLSKPKKCPKPSDCGEATDCNECASQKKCAWDDEGGVCKPEEACAPGKCTKKSRKCPVDPENDPCEQYTSCQECTENLNSIAQRRKLKKNDDGKNKACRFLVLSDGTAKCVSKKRCGRNPQTGKPIKIAGTGGTGDVDGICLRAKQCPAENCSIHDGECRDCLKEGCSWNQDNGECVQNCALDAPESTHCGDLTGNYYSVADDKDGSRRRLAPYVGFDGFQYDYSERDDINFRKRAGEMCKAFELLAPDEENCPQFDGECTQCLASGCSWNPDLETCVGGCDPSANTRCGDLVGFFYPDTGRNHNCCSEVKIDPEQRRDLAILDFQKPDKVIMAHRDAKKVCKALRDPFRDLPTCDVCQGPDSPPPQCWNCPTYDGWGHGGNKKDKGRRWPTTVGGDLQETLDLIRGQCPDLTVVGVEHGSPVTQDVDPCRVRVSYFPETSTVAEEPEVTCKCTHL